MADLEIDQLDAKKADPTFSILPDEIMAKLALEYTDFRLDMTAENIVTVTKLKLDKNRWVPDTSELATVCTLKDKKDVKLEALER